MQGEIYKLKRFYSEQYLAKNAGFIAYLLNTFASYLSGKSKTKVSPAAFHKELKGYLSMLQFLRVIGPAQRGFLLKFLSEQNLKQCSPTLLEVNDQASRIANKVKDMQAKDILFQVLTESLKGLQSGSLRTTDELVSYLT